ncbi:alpha/beta hydrolase-fold protein [Rhodococcus sp. G-MC3]|uniref:alpha/beta hydrolase n=1 Tax=Rhodococcus sp. G-MC3 TaxID=3046209 RepID=UPI0024BB97B0|nr:alpha/beta hydrolase-fold protein [Rhodococcus sp. G-MC3]MDJ0391997.1 alpha/beta hydrolase-fold protein [Rhodococcus sp. G-MC3]
MQTYRWVHDVALDVVHIRVDDVFPVIVTVAAAMAVLLWLLVRERRIGIVAALVVVAAVLAQLNAHLVGYPTIAAVLGHPPVVDADLDDLQSPTDLVVADGPLQAGWTPPRSMPPIGDVIEADIPGPVSGFHARPASIYVPPAYLTDPRADLPVLVLLTGQPGHVVDWIDGGHLGRTMDTFAARHDGLAPVVIVADALGDADANPMCMDSALGNVFSYLSVDLPAWAADHLQVSTDTKNWAIGGYSYGGTCALQTAVRAPITYPTFLDISGEDEPRRGSREESITAAFGDDSERSQQLFDDVAPLTVMSENAFSGSAGAFVVGAEDDEFRPQTHRAFDAAVAAGIDSRYLELPGGHSMDVWAPALEGEMGWLGVRMGLTD